LATSNSTSIYTCLTDVTADFWKSGWRAMGWRRPFKSLGVCASVANAVIGGQRSDCDSLRKQKVLKIAAA
jgi:hypothetical protein